ncbi:LysR family transcriptional regulator [Kribbella sp. CA-253562]|uniref:LysR family transcriptional regulator n=1 Tax=Kribbella sp. CA-253562 TaxID=3239942 RepID=UPI003D8EE897
MELELRHLRLLVAIVDAGSFTDAAIALGVSQASVSRGLAGLERALGVRVLHRTSRSITLTATGAQLVTRARQLLDEVDDLVREATSGHARLRLGHPWSALGRHTTGFQRRWATLYPDVELLLVRTNTPTGGLAEGACDLAVVRTAVDEKAYANTVVGVERRHLVLAADDPWARRRSVRLDEVRSRTVLVDRRTGTTSVELWPTGTPPRIEYTADVDDWLALIAAGDYVGITPESTATQYARAGVVFLPLKDAPPIPVRVIWPRQDPHPSTQAAVALISEAYAK